MAICLLATMHPRATPGTSPDLGFGGEEFFEAVLALNGGWGGGGMWKIALFLRSTLLLGSHNGAVGRGEYRGPWS